MSRGYTSRACWVAAAFALSAAPSFAVYQSIEHNIVGDEPSAFYADGVLTIRSHSNLLTLNDPSPLPGPIENVTVELTAAIDEISADKRYAYSRRGWYSLRFDYWGSTGQAYELIGPVDQLRFTVNVFRPWFSTLDADGSFEPLVINLPGSNHWPDSTYGACSSIDTLSIVFPTDLSGFDWTTDLASNEVVYNLTPETGKPLSGWIGPVGAVSRKPHGPVGVFDVDLPVCGFPVSEPRISVGETPGPTEILFTFDEPVDGTNGPASCDNVVLSSGTCLDVSGGGTEQLRVTLTDASPNSCGRLLFRDLAGAPYLDPIWHPWVNLSTLVGDADGNGRTELDDLALIKSRLSEPVGSSNFRCDLNSDGRINLADFALARINLYHRDGCRMGRFVVSAETVAVPECDTVDFTVRLLENPYATIQASVARTFGDADIDVTAGATLTFDAGNYDVPQTVTLTAADDPDADEDKALIFVTADDYIPAIIHATEVEDDLLP